jgi:hypothetical protein
VLRFSHRNLCTKVLVTLETSLLHQVFDGGLS